MPEKDGRLHEQCAATTWVVYQLTIRRAKPCSDHNGRSSRSSYLLAMLSLTELSGTSIVPTLRDRSS